MGEARKRKNRDGTYREIKGDAYKYEQWRLIERFKKYMEKMEKKND